MIPPFLVLAGNYIIFAHYQNYVLMIHYMSFQNAILLQIKDSASVENIGDLIMKGGLIMIPIILLSVISLYFFIERYTYIRRSSVIDPDMVKAMIRDIRTGDFESARKTVEISDSATSRILAGGLARHGKTRADMEGMMESQANIEISDMEKNTGYLGIIAGIAPMLGFIGTISGVIKIFYNISLADNISIGLIAGGLYQKMICSGAGLIVGVIAYSFYHYLQMMIDRYSVNMQKQVNELLKVI